MQSKTIEKDGKQDMAESYAFDETVLEEIDGDNAKSIAARRYNSPKDRGGPVERVVSQQKQKLTSLKENPVKLH